MIRTQEGEEPIHDRAQGTRLTSTASLRFRLPAYATWRHAAGGITYLLFLLLIVTGVLLSFYYRPSAAEAYQSIQYIVSGVQDERFQKILGGMITPAQFERIGAALAPIVS